jgi:hypothetical protein
MGELEPALPPLLSGAGTHRPTEKGGGNEKPEERGEAVQRRSTNRHAEALTADKRQEAKHGRSPFDGRRIVARGRAVVKYMFAIRSEKQGVSLQYPRILRTYLTKLTT